MFRQFPTMRLLLPCCLSPFGLVVIAAAQHRPPSTLSAAELIARARAAAEELGRLDAKAGADREAFRANEADLRYAIARLEDPLPEQPQPLRDVPYEDESFISEQLEKAAAFKKAWTKRQDHLARTKEALAALDGLSSGLRENHELLFDRVGDLRPLFVEAQRRIDRGDIRAAQFELAEGARSIAAWVARTGELKAQRGELLGSIEEAIGRLKADRAKLAAVPPEPELREFVSLIEMALAAVAEARALGKDVEQQLKKTPAEQIPSEVGRAVEEWTARRKALSQAGAVVDERLQTLEKTIGELETLEPAHRAELPAGEGLREIRRARQDVEHSQRMIAYFERYAELLQRSDGERRAALAALEQVLVHHATFVRQCSRTFEVLRYAERLASEKALPRWQPPEDVSRAIIWQEWKQSLRSQYARRSARERLQAELNDAADLARARDQLTTERTNKRRAEARLEIERSLAASVERLREDPDDRLVALLAPDGELAATLQSIEAEIAAALARRAAALRACEETAATIESIENPYTAVVLRQQSDRVAAIRAELDGLQEGALPPDESARLQPDAMDFDSIGIADDFRANPAHTVATVADLERQYLERGQQATQVFLDYFTGLEANLQALRAHEAALEELQNACEAAMQRRIQAEKRRYAAAREIRRRLDLGRFDPSRSPEKLDEWLARGGIQHAETELANTRRDSRRFGDRMDYEIERLEILLGAKPLFEARSRAAAERVRLIGRPVTYLAAALTPPNKLEDTERKKLDYDAQLLESEATSTLHQLLKRFTSEGERGRFEEPLRTFYLELANTGRVIEDIDKAAQAYRDIIEVCGREKTDLAPASEILRGAAALRLSDYHAARASAGVAVHPDSRARIEERFREAFQTALRYRLNFREGGLAYAASLLLSSEARLIGQRALSESVERLLSKVGIDREIGWYRSQVARIGSLREVAIGRQSDLRQRIAGLTTTYHTLLRNNALQGLAVVLVIPLIAFFLVRLLRRLARHAESRLIAKAAEGASDRQRRLRTLSATSTAAISVLIWTVALIYIFARLGLDITPIVASASVVGLAVAFGAQALIKDFFYGFFILIENQFTIGDVVTLGAITGTVEKISLRITVLRDLRGVVHYIPNGTIGQVSNKTQGWSRVVMEVSVAHDEDPDRAANILGDVLLELASDEKWSRDVIEDPVVAGIENVTESSVDIRVMIKTRPGRQWAVAREARRRIKQRFRELGITTPFPHRVVHHVYQDAPGDTAGVEGPSQTAGPRRV